MQLHVCYMHVLEPYLWSHGFSLAFQQPRNLSLQPPLPPGMTLCWGDVEHRLCHHEGSVTPLSPWLQHPWQHRQPSETAAGGKAISSRHLSLHWLLSLDILLSAFMTFKTHLFAHLWLWWELLGSCCPSTVFAESLLLGISNFCQGLTVLSMYLFPSTRSTSVNVRLKAMLTLKCSRKHMCEQQNSNFN